MKKISLFFILCCAFSAFSLQAKENKLFNVSPKVFSEVLQNNKAHPDWFLLDIRTPGEFTKKRIAGATLVDMSKPDFSKKISDLDREKTYMLYCEVGGRSWQTMLYMSQLGFKNVYNMKGGIAAWEKEGFPIER